jgi:ribosomal protein S18 acetylase RimI-like enzyme
MNDDSPLISYADSVDGITVESLAGFFDGWPDPPTPATHLRILQRSSHVVLAIHSNRVVGFITAVSDDTLAAYIPLLEVLPDYQGRGIGGQLVVRMLKRLEGMYMVDLVCDDDKVGFYERFSLKPARAMIQRDFSVQSGIED